MEKPEWQYALNVTNLSLEKKVSSWRQKELEDDDDGK